MRLQIEKDVAQINNHEVWKQALNNIPLEINCDYGKCEIIKKRFPEVYITVQNGADTIEIQAETKKSDESKTETRREVFKVDSDGKKIYLKGDNGTLHVPEETARYILTPIIKALNGTFQIRFLCKPINFCAELCDYCADKANLCADFEFCAKPIAQALHNN